MAGRPPGLIDLTEHTFTPDRTRPVAEAACRLIGLDPAGAVLLRHQTNAVYRLLSAPVVIKVARPGEQHLAEVVKLVSWLSKHDVPSVALWDKASQPLEVAGCAVTLWRYLPQARPITAGDIALPLQLLHSVPSPPFSLPALDPFGEIRRSIAGSRILTAEQRSLLLDRCSQLAEDEPGVSYDLPPGLIHGDAQHRNTLWDPDTGHAVLCDWESAAVAQQEWDLITVEVHCRRFGHPPNEYADFCDRYGRDIREWAGYPWLRNVRELRMITTNARKSVSGSPAADEVHRRVSELLSGTARGWQIL